MKVHSNTAVVSAALVATCSLAITLLAPSATAQVRPQREQIPNFDKRVRAEPNATEVAQREQARSQLKAQLPSADVSFDELLDTPKFVRAYGGFLTGPNGQGLAVSAPTAQAIPANDPYGPVKGFLIEHSALFGHGDEVLANARITRESVGAQNGLRTVVWQQQVDGLPVFDTVLIGNITKRGELVSLASKFLPHPDQSAEAGTPNRAALQAQPPVSVEQAIVRAAQNLGDTLVANDVASRSPEEAGAGYRAFDAQRSKAYARLVWLPMNRTTMRLCWEVYLSKQTTPESFQILIDAETGEALLRRGRTEYISDATYNVYTSDSPSPFSPGWPTPNNGQPPLTNRVLVTLSALDTTASPDGWINDGDNQTQGNNVDAFLDRNFDQQPDGPRPQGNPARTFDFPLNLTQAPDTYTDAATVQLFYLANWYHDRVYQLGFTESAGNFQQNNFGRGGLGNDRVLAYVQAGASVGIANNASFGTPPDGISGEMNMFIWDGSNPDRDGSLDADIVFHEATHGTSTRLVGGGVLINALQTDGMGEGWSDFYALSFLSEPADDPDAVYAAGGYVGFQLFGISFANYYFGVRHYPYTTDMAKNPFTFKDIDPGQVSAHTGVPLSPIYPFNTQEADEVHHQGEVWCVTLWESRANLIHKYGPSGNQLMLQLVTDGMKLSPADPTFLEARDAIILADLVNNGGANSLELWRGFAKRGMGFSARSPASSTTAGVVEAYDVPGLTLESLTISGGNGNGVIDVNECNDVQIVLRNTLGEPATGISVRLDATVPGVAFGAKFSTYPNLVPGQSATNSTPLRISTAPSFLCGTLIPLRVTIKSDQATSTNTIVLNTGTNGIPIRFDSTNAVLIPDASLPGTNSFVTVTNVTSAIGKVTVALFLTHTFDADLKLELIAPDGTTVSLSANHGGSGNNYGVGCAPDSFRTTFDDDAAQPIGSGAPPFTGSFKPDLPLSVFAGKSGTNINGAWRLHVVDSFRFDVGTLQCWSLFLSPAGCADGGGTCPGADLALGLKDAPDPVFIGSNLVYSLSVTNSGPSDAKNVVANQFLPGSVVFVSAVASQGSAVNAGGTVVCNLGLLPLSGVATVSVTVTPTTAGPITSTASVSAIDTDPDTSNNSASATTQVNPATSDLAVGIFDAPDPALVGGPLAYTVSVTNNGPSTASGVTVTNTLPLSVIIHSVTPSQGFATINGNVVACIFGTVTNGGRPTATINVTPTAQGTIFATATASGNQVDPITANSSATATTTVGPASDLSITLVDTPDPVVVRSNWTYFITVTNFGPSTASGVVVNHTLPANVSVVSSNTTQGTIALAGGVITANLGTLTNGGMAAITVVVNATNSGSYASSASVSGAQADQNTGNNNASTATTVAPRNVTIVTAGATLKAESIVPANGSLDVGETVTVELRLRNAGNVPNTNLFATLLATGGVTAPSPGTATSYGVLAPSDFPVGRLFTFTASGTNGGTVVATLQLQDGGNNLGTVNFTFTLPNVKTFANTNAITILDNSKAAPYPSSNTVAGVVGLVGNVTVTLSNLNHTFPDDVDVLLLGPNGTNGPKVIVMSDAGGLNGLTNVTLKLDDTASVALPDDGQILSAAYRPADYEPGDPFDLPAPAGPYGSSLSSFAGANPNGVWLLYVMDDTGGDSGNIANGWSLSFTTITPVNQLADLGLSVVTGSASRVLVSGNLTFTYTVTNAGPNAATFVAFTNIVPAGAVLVTATPSQGTAATNGNTVVGNLGTLNAGATATITVVVRPTAGGSLTNTATVAAAENDLNPANNTASAVVSVNVPVADAAVSLTATNSVVIGSNVTFTISVANNGPEPALNVVVTDPLPAGLSFVGTSASSFFNSAGTVTVNLGDLASGATAPFTITATATSTGPQTNIALITTTSSDTNSANNSASAVITVTVPAPLIVAAGAILTAESFVPPNVTVDVGETVTLSLSLQNVGSADTANLQATLLATGGVSAPSGPQAYGALAHGGAGVARPFTFTATGANGGAVVATLQLQDGANNLGTVAFVFKFPATVGFTNPSAITIPDHGGATPYPSTIAVTGVTGKVSKVTVSLYGLTHAFPDDVDILLVGPTGRKLVLMSDAGGGHTITNLTLTFDDAGAALPDSALIGAGAYAPTDYEPGETFPPPAPVGDLGSTFAVFNGTNPEGTWSLYVADDSTGDAGTIAGGWSLSLTVVDTVNPTADLVIGVTDAPDPIFVGSGLTYTITVNNNGPVGATGVSVTDALPAGLIFISASSSQGSLNTNGNTVTANLGALAAGSGGTVSIRVAPSVGGQLVNSASVTANETDLSLANNTATATTTVIGPAPILLTDAAVTNGQFQMVLTGEPGLTYVIQASTNLVSWLPVGTNTAGANGTFKFTDVTPSFSKRFYRGVRLIP